MGPEASSDEYVSIVEAEICIAIVFWHDGSSCIGVICWAGEDIGGGKDKECGVPTCMGDVKSCSTPTHIGVVLCTGNPLPKPGAWLAAVGVCSVVLRTLRGPVLTCG